MLCTENASSRPHALRREAQIKRLKRAEKHALIETFRLRKNLNTKGRARYGEKSVWTKKGKNIVTCINARRKR